MALDLLYFARVREELGRGAEQVDPPAEVATVRALLDWLAGQSDAHRAAFADRSQLRVAVDQRFAGFDAPITGAGEVAIFPPVTGG